MGDRGIELVTEENLFGSCFLFPKVAKGSTVSCSPSQPLLRGRGSVVWATQIMAVKGVTVFVTQSIYYIRMSH